MPRILFLRFFVATLTITSIAALPPDDVSLAVIVFAAMPMLSLIRHAADA